MRYLVCQLLLLLDEVSGRDRLDERAIAQAFGAHYQAAFDPLAGVRNRSMGVSGEVIEAAIATPEHRAGEPVRL
ncbi:hypothetical protein [Rubidibacter lacunae]|uniref:hypothetical protein n=1 Tax=Rubidibacter lacunae TaxID=582514 RepID=UPI0012EC90A7|nr:hypothetical protein [Rubidibacter lacunae]